MDKTQFQKHFEKSESQRTLLMESSPSRSIEHSLIVEKGINNHVKMTINFKFNQPSIHIFLTNLMSRENQC